MGGGGGTDDIADLKARLLALEAVNGGAPASFRDRECGAQS